MDEESTELTELHEPREGSPEKAEMIRHTRCYIVIAAACLMVFGCDPSNGVGIPAVDTYSSGTGTQSGTSETEDVSATDSDSGVETAPGTDSETEAATEAATETATETQTEPDTETETETETDEGLCTDPYLCSAFTPDNPVIGEDVSRGSVTTYGSPDHPENSVGGACNYGQTGIRYYAAIHVHVSAADSDFLGPWKDGHACGGCMHVRTRTADGWLDSFARITDRCADEFCGIDLGGAPAADVMPLGPGRYEGEWWWESCEGHPEVFDGPTALYVKDGSNDFWALVQVRNPLSQISGLFYATGENPDPSAFVAMEWAIEAENFYRVPPEMLQDDGLFTIRIDYAMAESQTVVVKGTDLAVAEASITI